MALIISQLDRNAVHDAVYGTSTIPRLKTARGYFYDLNQDEIPLLVESFLEWRDYDECILLWGKNRLDPSKPDRWKAFKCSKRGNDVFAKRLDDKLGFLNQLPDKQFFNISDFKPGVKVHARLLWVTLTYDSKRCSLGFAWKNIMKEFNLWITRLRQHYGKIWYFWFIQAFPNENGKGYGYPHLHIALLFEGKDDGDFKGFEVFPRMENNRDGELGLVYRIQEKDEFHDVGNWHSFTDVKAISSMKGLLKYCRIHSQHVAYGDSDEAVLNCALSWLYKKHTYSVSGSFRSALRVHFSLRISKGVFQKTLEGGMISEWDWKFLGVFSSVRLGIKDSFVWSKELDFGFVDKLLNP